MNGPNNGLLKRIHTMTGWYMQSQYKAECDSGPYIFGGEFCGETCWYADPQ